MESKILDPFGDYETQGYLRNTYQEKDIRVVGHLETAAFEQEIIGTLRFLKRLPTLQYEHLTETHLKLFSSLYPWAGQDRFITAPNIAIVKAGYKTLFAHPADVRRAAEHALFLGQNEGYLRVHPGEVFGYLAYAHPFLEGNGRTILTVFSELTRRARFHVEWEAIDKDQFLNNLTQELLQPGKSIMDQLLAPYWREGVLSIDRTARTLRTRFKRPEGTPP
ncbi:MAG TPA: Fic family protein [Candidatus Angelobacter sp.]|nr:Fic family protein [Candidatus Angelobacter sp.]